MHSFLNFLKKNKLYTAINITGLTVSMAFVLLLACYVTKQLRTDSFQQNADRIYLVASERQYESAYYLQTYLRQRYPEIEKTTAFAGQSSMEIHSGDNMVLGTVGIADSTFFDMFSFRLTEGSNEAWEGAVTSAVISRTLARTLFPGQDPLGQPVTVMLMGSAVELNVAAVMEDIDNSTIPYCDIMVRGEWLPRLNPSHNMGLGNSGSVLTFIMTWPGADIVSKTADMLEYFKEHWWIYKGGASKEVVLIPLDELYFHGGSTWSGLRVGDKSLVMLLLSVCIVLLLFAVLNYINLTTAQAGFRAREMATRRLLGDSRGQVIGRMLGETGILCVTAMLLAVLLAEALSPAASRLLGYDFSIFGEASAASIAAVVLLTAVLSVVSGIVPAAIISASRPIDVVRGTFRTRNRTVYSRVMIVVQNAVTAVMLVAVLTMALQIRAMIKAPLGYNTENILNVSTDIFDDISGPFVFRDRLQELSCVDAVGLGEGTPLYGTNNLTMHYNGGLVSFQQFRGDDAYFEILGIREKQDNHTAEASWWFNEYAFREMGIDESAPEAVFEGGNKFTIGGIYYDFKIRPLLYAQSSAMIFNLHTWPREGFPWTVLVKVNGDPAEAYAQIAAVFHELRPDRQFEASYIRDEIDENFSTQKQTLRIVLIFTVIAVLLSSLGLLAMSTYYMLQERKNVAVKKIFGGERRRILLSLILYYLRLVLLAFVIAIPIAWLLMHSWLKGYLYHIDLHWWIFAIACVLTLTVSTLTVLWQSIRAADTSPVDALRKE